MGDLSAIDRLKIILRENDCPMFTDEEIQFYLDENNGDFDDTAYQMLVIKSENTTLNLSGFETGDTSKYFRRLALRYRKNNGGVLKG